MSQECLVVWQKKSIYESVALFETLITMEMETHSFRVICIKILSSDGL